MKLDEQIVATIDYSKLFESFAALPNASGVKNQHLSKNWWGRLMDWVKWKTPLRKHFDHRYERLEVVEHDDLQGLYLHFLVYPRPYGVKNSWPHIKVYTKNPYDTWDITFQVPQPIQYITCDFELTK